mmetsp:Transcript_71578/g.180646  ORF Transcript_71578/g.180646 Transcript_71578/m.180646 type:complete len:402 (-) Transcript_71578:230-1435(-)
MARPEARGDRLERMFPKGFLIGRALELVLENRGVSRQVSPGSELRAGHYEVADELLCCPEVGRIAAAGCRRVVQREEGLHAVGTPIQFDPLPVQTISEAIPVFDQRAVGEVPIQLIVQPVPHLASWVPVNILIVLAAVHELSAIIHVHSHQHGDDIPMASRNGVERVAFQHLAVHYGPPLAGQHCVPIRAPWCIGIHGSVCDVDQVPRLDVRLDEALHVGQILAALVLGRPRPLIVLLQLAHRLHHGIEIICRVLHVHCDPLVETSTLHGGAVEETGAPRARQMSRYSASARGFAKYHHVVGVAAECLDVGLDPAEGLHLVQEAHVAGGVKTGSAVRVLAMALRPQEAEHTQAVIEGDDDNVTESSHQLDATGLQIVARVCGEPAAINPDHHCSQSPVGIL